MEMDMQRHFGKHEDAKKIMDFADQIENGTLHYPQSNQAIAIDQAVTQIAGDAREHRVERLNTYIGDASPEVNEAKLKTAIKRLVHDDDGNQISAQEFSEKLYAIYGLVFTGHPVTSKTVEEGKAIADNAYLRNVKASPEAIQAADKRLEDAAKIPFQKPTLDTESANSIEAIRSTREARAKITQIAMDLGQELYGDEWTEIDYMPTTVATWIPFDWDGRTDVEPQDIMHRRIQLQTLMLEEYAERFAQLKDMLQDPADQIKVQSLIDRIESTHKNMTECETFFANYDKKADSDGKLLEQTYDQFKKDAEWRLTDPKDLINPLNDILKTVPKDQNDTLKSLVHLRSDLRNDGLSFAQIHFRLNAKSLNSAIGEHGLDIDFDNPPEQVDKDCFDDLSKMVDNVKPTDTDLIKTMNSKQTVAKQMGMISEFDKYIEQGRNVRFLIAETDRAITPLTALYFAKQFGIEDKISISGLCEDRDGQNEFKRLSELLLTNQSYREHIFTPRENHPFNMSVEADQFGFSDSHRYDGAIAAGAHMGRAMGQKEKVLAGAIRDANENIKLHLTNFSTGGQSMNRGFHPLGPDQNAQYKLAPHVLKNARENDIKVTLETSLQGMDGNIYVLNPNMAFSYMTQKIDYLTDHKKHVELSNDPFYKKDGLLQDAFDVFETTRNTHESLINKSGYAEIIDQFVRSAPSTGSRPVKRPKDSGGERALPRAIQHGGTLSRLSMWSTVMDGVGAAISENEERFDRLCQSDVFRNQFLVTVQHALKETVNGVIRAEVELYNPKYWEERAKGFEDEKRQKQCLKVAKHVGRLGLHPDMIRVVEQMEQNAKTLQDAFDKRDMTLPVAGLTTQFNKNTLHGARIDSMRGIFEKAMSVPDIPENNHDDLTREKVIDRLLMFDRTVVDDLKDHVFPNHSETGYTHLHENVFEPIEDDFDLLQDGAAKPLIDYNNGVG